MNEVMMILLKPECIERNLEKDILEMMRKNVEFNIIARKNILVKDEDIIEQCVKLISRLGETVKKPLLEKYSNKSITLMLLQGEDIINKITKIIGPSDPIKATKETVRGRFSQDSFELSDKEGRMVNNIIHASDSVKEAKREFEIWFKNGINFEDIINAL